MSPEEPKLRPETASETAKMAEKRSGGLLRALKEHAKRAVLDNAGIKFVSLVLAVTLFILVNTGQDVTIWLEVDVAYVMPEDRVLVSEPVDKVTAGVRGSWRRTRRFDERELERIQVDLRDRESGLFEFQPHMFRIPQGLELVSITPRTMRLELEPLGNKSVPVEVELIGEPAPGYRVARVEPAPKAVTVRGARSKVNALDAVETLGVSLTGRRESFTDIVPLSVPENVQLEDGSPNMVDVEVELVEETDTNIIEDVPVEIAMTSGDPALAERYAVTPAKVDVILRGPQPAIERLLQKPLFPYVEVDPDEPGGSQARVHLNADPSVTYNFRPTSVTVIRK